MHYFGLGLAERDCDVHWVPCPATPFDIIGDERRKRLWRLVGKRHDKGNSIAPHLTEYTLPAIFNPTRKLLRHPWQLPTYRALLPRFFKKHTFDVCVFDVSPSAVYLPYINAEKFIFRINDPIEWQSNIVQSLMHRALSGEFESTLSAVSHAVSTWTKRLYPNRDVHVLPNGVNLTNYRHLRLQSKDRPKRAVFIGWLGDWLDLDLLDNAASLLPDWSIDIYGSGPVARKLSSPNTCFKGVVPHADIPHLLESYAVGLIPFKEHGQDMTFMERPLKFYEYLAAGLGIVSTTCGNMRQGMGDMALWGDTPEEMAKAIPHAAEWARTDIAARQTFLEEHDWRHVVDQFHQLICS